jgi:hypothetical protein
VGSSSIVSPTSARLTFFSLEVLVITLGIYSKALILFS